MHQPISWSALADASVGVWGLGVEGRASIRRLRTMGCSPVLVDDTPGTPTVDGLDVLATGSGGLEALLGCEVVVKSPGISRYRPEVARLEAAGVTVSGGLGLFMAEADPARVACITGTKGKSTTTALAVHLLTGLGYRARAGGNIGHPPWDPSPEPGPDYWVIETSSFQVPDLVAAPHVVAVTSLSPDHLDWHGSVERYYADKLSLCTKPGVTLALADGSDDQLRAQAALLGPHLRWVTAEDVERDAVWSTSLRLPGPHNARNASVARAVLVGMGVPGAADDDRIAARQRASVGCPAGATPWAASEASSSSTTACRRTCCRRRPRCAPSSSAPSPYSWVVTTAGSTTPRSAGPSHTAPRRRSSSPCRTTARASAPRCARPATARWR